MNSTVFTPRISAGSKPVLRFAEEFRHVRFSNTASIPQICSDLAAAISTMDNSIFSEQSGLYLSTSDAGIKTSVIFWEEALEHGPGLVGPRLFPWTLANGPATCLARELGLKGPNITLVGGLDILEQLQDMAIDDLQKERVENCLVVYLCLNDGEAFVYLKGKKIEP